MTEPGVESFASLDELRCRHAQLLRASKASPAQEEGKTAFQAADVFEFLNRARATGAKLDFQADREAAQSVVDYWTATLFTLPNEVSAEFALPTTIPESSSGEINLQLVEFDRGTIQAAVQVADAWLRRPGTEQSLARWILLRLVRLRADTPTFDVIPTARAALFDLETQERVNAAVDGLAEAGVVRVSKGVFKGESEEMDRIALRSADLLREWSKLKEWLDGRLSFRKRVDEWHTAGCPASGLAAGEELEEARRYHDRNSREREFVNRSAYQQGRKLEMAAVDRAAKLRWRLLALVAILGWLTTAWFYWHVRTAQQEAAKAASTAEEQTKIAKKYGEQLAHRQQLTNLRRLVRNLAEVLSTRQNVKEHELAVSRWERFVALVASGSEDEYGPLRSLDLQALNRKITDPANTGSLSADDIAQIRALHAQILDGSGLNAAAVDLARDQSYALVEVSARGIVDVLRRGRPFGEAAPSFREFWTQYWGEMLLVETAKVEREMVQFGTVLQKIQAEVERPRKESSTHVDKFAKHLKGGPKEFEQKVRSLNAATLSQLKQEYSQIPADDYNAVLADVDSRNVSQSLLTELNDRLQPLLGALNRERKRNAPLSAGDEAL